MCVVSPSQQDGGGGDGCGGGGGGGIGGGDGVSAGRTPLYMLCIVDALNVHSSRSLCGLRAFLHLTLQYAAIRIHTVHTQVFLIAKLTL